MTAHNHARQILPQVGTVTFLGRRTLAPQGHDRDAPVTGQALYPPDPARFGPEQCRATPSDYYHLPHDRVVETGTSIAI